jgi:Leucine-rich repeat (LRR) protein
MKQLFALFFILFSYLSVAQLNHGRVYLWNELAGVNPDTIRAISFEKMKLDSLPNELWKFTNITYLSLEKNQLAYLPEDFNKLTQLTELNIEKNKFTFFPLVICQLPNLKKLNASRNRVESIPNQIENCSHLESIDLYDNLIGDFGTGIFQLKELRTLNIEGVMYGTNFADDLKRKLPNVKIILDPPCKCLN